jgi:hypothetical protein
MLLTKERDMQLFRSTESIVSTAAHRIALFYIIAAGGRRGSAGGAGYTAAGGA